MTAYVTRRKEAKNGKGKSKAMQGVWDGFMKIAKLKTLKEQQLGEIAQR
jgi:hypothetical protein